MDTVQHFFANVKSRSFYLNYSMSRKLDVCLKSIVPTIEFVIKLTATDHDCHVEFSKDTWNEIVNRSEEIRRTMERETEEEIFSNEELRVFTEERHGQCAICFVDRRDERVNMMIRTFKKMMSTSYSVSATYRELLNDIKSTATGIEKFIDNLVAKCQACRVKSRAYLNHLSELQDGIKQLRAQPDLPSLEVDYYDESDSDDEEYHHYRRRRYR